MMMVTMLVTLKYKRIINKQKRIKNKRFKETDTDIVLFHGQASKITKL